MGWRTSLLKIIKSNELIRVDNICVTIYKLPGIGGTSLAFSAGKVLLFDTDDGSYRSGNRGDTVRPKEWAEIANLTAEDVAGYDVIALDTVGRALDMLTIHLLKQDPKLGRKSGDLSLQGFGALKTAFITWKNKMLSFHKDVIFCSHMDEKQEGDIIKERFDIQGGSRAEIYKSSDAIAKLFIDGKSRKLDFSPREGSLGKNPAQFDILTVPNFAVEPQYFASVIADIKKALNKMSEAQTEVQDEIKGWRALLTASKTAADFNALLPQAIKASQAVKMLIMAEATQKGLKFDKEEKAFYAPDTPTGCAQLIAGKLKQFVSENVDFKFPEAPQAPETLPGPPKPQEGAVTSTEQASQDNPTTAIPERRAENVTPPTTGRKVPGWEIAIHDLRRKCGIPDAEYHQVLRDVYGCMHTREMHISQRIKMQAYLLAYERAAEPPVGDIAGDGI